MYTGPNIIEDRWHNNDKQYHLTKNSNVQQIFINALAQ